MPVARLAVGDHLAGGHVQGGEQGGCAVADVVVGHTFHVSQVHGQYRQDPVEGLDLRLLVDAEHHRLIRWVLVEADDVADLLNKEGIR